MPTLQKIAVILSLQSRLCAYNLRLEPEDGQIANVDCS